MQETIVQGGVQEKTGMVRDQVSHLLVIMGFEKTQVNCAYQEVPVKEGGMVPCLRIAIDAQEEGRTLIGLHGTHLLALSQVVRSILRRVIDERVIIKVDVNGYLAARERGLQQLADDAAHQAVLSGRAVVLPPMSPAERHLIHTTLADKQGISTGSLGEEPNRRVIVRPVMI